MSKGQRSNREQKKPKQEKKATAPVTVSPVTPVKLEALGRNNKKR